MRRREHQEEALDQLGSEARSVLAVLVMAGLWPGRYPGGWVSVRVFAEDGVLLGERTDRESLKAAIRRGLRRVAQTAGAPSVECRRSLEHDALTDRARRDRDRRLVEPPGVLLEGWLIKNGPGLISPDAWRHFFPARQATTVTACSGARDLVRRSLRQAEACIGFAALAVPPKSPEAVTLRRIQRALIDSLRAMDGQDGPG